MCLKIGVAAVAHQEHHWGDRAKISGIIESFFAHAPENFSKFLGGIRTFSKLLTILLSRPEFL